MKKYFDGLSDRGLSSIGVTGCCWSCVGGWGGGGGEGEGEEEGVGGGGGGWGKGGGGRLMCPQLRTRTIYFAQSSCASGTPGHGWSSKRSTPSIDEAREVRDA